MILTPDINDIKQELDKYFNKYYLDENKDYKHLWYIDYIVEIYVNYLYNTFFRLNEDDIKKVNENITKIKEKYRFKRNNVYNSQCLGSTCAEDFFAETISIKIKLDNIDIDKKYGADSEVWFWEASTIKINSLEGLITSLILSTELIKANDLKVIEEDPYD